MAAGNIEMDKVLVPPSTVTIWIDRSITRHNVNNYLFENLLRNAVCPQHRLYKELA